MGQKPETRLVTQIIKTLREYGGFWIKIHGSPYQTAGIPDIVGCYNGRFIALEVKRPGYEKTTNSRQELIMERIRKAGGISAVVTNKFEALKRVEEANAED